MSTTTIILSFFLSIFTIYICTILFYNKVKWKHFITITCKFKTIIRNSITYKNILIIFIMLIIALIVKSLFNMFIYNKHVSLFISILVIGIIRIIIKEFFNISIEEYRKMINDHNNVHKGDNKVSKKGNKVIEFNAINTNLNVKQQPHISNNNLSNLKYKPNNYSLIKYENKIKSLVVVNDINRENYILKASLKIKNK